VNDREQNAAEIARSSRCDAEAMRHMRIRALAARAPVGYSMSSMRRLT
jgi:hypothetical protein